MLVQMVGFVLFAGVMDVFVREIVCVCVCMSVSPRLTEETRKGKEKAQEQGSRL